MVLSIGGGVFLSSPASAEIILQPGFDQFSLGNVGGRTRAWGIGIADFNGDDYDDIISGDTFGDVHLYTGNGDGTFTDQGVTINTLYFNAFSIVTGDFNGDGDMDFVMGSTRDYSDAVVDGGVYLYLGNGDGTFESYAWYQAGLFVGDAGTDVMALAAADVDNDDDMDIVAGDVTASENGRADVILYRNEGNDPSGHPTWIAETIISAPNVSPVPDQPPYYPPLSYLHSYGLAFGDMDNDGYQDLLVSDRASYLYIYRNNGLGNFEPVQFDRIGTRPYAYDRLHVTFTSHMALAAGDLNGDSLIDIVAGGTDSSWEGQVDLWLNIGLDSENRPVFNSIGIIGGAGTDARGLALGQLNPSEDDYLDVVFGNFEGNIYGLFTDIMDTDGDGIIDRFDNARFIANPPRLDMNGDGGINYLDQLDNDHDGVGDPADDDDDDDGVQDNADNCPFSSNPEQKDGDGDSWGDACDPLMDADADGDGIPEGPTDPDLMLRAFNAKTRWSMSNTHFIIRIDALGRVFQNEFTQTLVDGAILGNEEWELKKFENYNGIGDDPAVLDYQVPDNLPGGMNVPMTLVVIPKLIWNAFGDDDPIRWINDRNVNPNLEIGQHGTYHENNTMLGDWADDPTRNYFACEECGFTVEEMFQYLRIGTRTLLGDYELDPWIVQSGAEPGSPRIDWNTAANQLISYAPPFNAYDTAGREAEYQLGYLGFSASIYEEQNTIFSPMSYHEKFDEFGMFHASADLEVDSEPPPGMDYLQYLESITQDGLNTWLIEEVEWAQRYCNDLDRLDYCPEAPGGINRENNMIDEERWGNWLILLDYVKNNGQVMTMGDYALAMSFDNAPTVYNPDQTDADHNGIGDAIEGVVLEIEDRIRLACAEESKLTARLLKRGRGITDQIILFYYDADGDGILEEYTGTTNEKGIAYVVVVSTRNLGPVEISASWDGLLASAADTTTAKVVHRGPGPSVCPKPAK
jgi:hypothetical protein